MPKATEDKPIVQFVGMPRFFKYMGGGARVASVRAIDHPVWGFDEVRTSKVMKINEDGSFETLNTRYVPV